MTLEILTRDEYAALVLAQLAKGTLISLRDGITPIQAAVWSITEPIVYAPESLTETIPEELLIILKSCDELKLATTPDDLRAYTQDLIDRLDRWLESSPIKYWRMTLQTSNVIEDRRAERRRARERQLAERQQDGDGVS